MQCRDWFPVVRSGLQVPPVGLQRGLHGRLQRNDGPAQLLVARARPRPARHGDVAGVPHEGGAGPGCSGAEHCKATQEIKGLFKNIFDVFRIVLMCTLQAYYTYMRDVAELLGAEPETASKEMLEVSRSVIRSLSFQKPFYHTGVAAGDRPGQHLSGQGGQAGRQQALQPHADQGARQPRPGHPLAAVH